MLQRIYSANQEMLDEAAEKAVCLFGDLRNQEKLCVLIDKFGAKPGSQPEERLNSSLAIEKEFQKLCKKVYSILKENEEITLGLDDMIMAHASKSEVNSYLLQQRLDQKAAPGRDLVSSSPAAAAPPAEYSEV